MRLEREVLFLLPYIRHKLLTIKILKFKKITTAQSLFEVFSHVSS